MGSEVQSKREVALQLISELTRSRSNLSDGLQQQQTRNSAKNVSNFVLYMENIFSLCEVELFVILESKRILIPVNLSTIWVLILKRDWDPSHRSRWRNHSTGEIHKSLRTNNCYLT